MTGEATATLRTRVEALDLSRPVARTEAAEEALWQHLSAIGGETDDFTWVSDVEEGFERVSLSLERGGRAWEPSSSGSWNRISIWHPDRHVSSPDRLLRQRGDGVGAPIVAAARATLGRRWRVHRTRRTYRRWRQTYAGVPAPASVHRLAVAAADEEALARARRPALADFEPSSTGAVRRLDELQARSRFREAARTYESARFRVPVLEPLVRALEAGLLFFWVLEGKSWRQRSCVCVPRPELHLRNGRLHRYDGPAAAWPSGVAYWFWEGVSIPRRALRADGTVRDDALVWTTNAERRRVLLERLGPERFLAAAHGRRVAQDDFGRLWRTTLEVEGEPLAVVEVVNATAEADGTYRRYWLRVPPTMRTARQAVAWSFGFDDVGEYVLSQQS